MSLLRTIELDADQHLYGRNKEIKLLLEAYSRCQDDKGGGTPECVLITGASGMGKTSLVQSVLRPKVASDHGLFLSGKFELSPHYQPYEVIVSTFAQLADQILGEDLLHETQLAIADALGDEVRLLTDVIPGLERVIGQQLVDSSNIPGTESLSQFQFVFCEFCRAVSSVAPLVIFLDDMQWSDQASLELIQALLRPKLSSAESNTNSSILLVAASRDELEEVNQDCNREEKSDEEVSPHVYMVKTFLNGAKPSRNVSRIHLSSLSEAETRDLIVHNFGLTREAAQAIAPLAYSKCCGNILHTLQFMRSLRIGDAGHQHEFDETKAMENVSGEPQKQETVEKLIIQRVHKLPVFAQQLLQMAACMGNFINEEAICTVTGSPAEEIALALETATEQELLEMAPKRAQYRFIHDSVRQAVLSIIADKTEMSFRIGHTLWQKSTLSCKDSCLFTIVNLLNKGVALMSDKQERYKVAESNLLAGRRAASKVSFRDASRYFSSGIQFLRPGDFWAEQYDLALQLHAAAAAAELSNRNFGRVEWLIGEIFRNARCLKDKLDAYATQIMATGQQGKAVEATNIGLDVLGQLGENVPTQTEILDLRVVALEAQRALRGRSNADILSLPYMEDEEKQATMRFLLMMIPYALEAGSPYANWIAIRMVRLTLSHGLSKGCAHGFASYARFVCTSNARLGYNYGQLAASIVEKCGAKDLMPRVYVSIYSMSSMWTRPLRESLNPLQTAFEVAVENGDVEYALIAAYFHSVFSLYVGMNLIQVEQLLKETRRKLDFYKQSLLTNLTNVTLQFVLNLAGKAPDPVILAGDAFSLDDRQCSSAVSYMFHGFSTKLAYLYEDFDRANQLAQVLFIMSSRVPFTSYWFAIHQFQMGLIAIAQVRRGIEPEQNLERARLCIQKMVGWARDCPHNFLNKKALLDAELESLNSLGTIDTKVLSLYNQAIEGALEEGFLDEAAMACERAGDYMHRQNNIVEAERFWNQAQRIFRRWGATSKAEALKTRVATTQSCCRTESCPVKCAS